MFLLELVDQLEQSFLLGLEAQDSLFQGLAAKSELRVVRLQLLDLTKALNKSTLVAKEVKEEKLHVLVRRA